MEFWEVKTYMDKLEGSVQEGNKHFVFKFNQIS